MKQKMWVILNIEVLEIITLKMQLDMKVFLKNLKTKLKDLVGKHLNFNTSTLKMIDFQELLPFKIPQDSSQEKFM